jgi:hypothetical protein
MVMSSYYWGECGVDPRKAAYEALQAMVDHLPPLLIEENRPLCLLTVRLDMTHLNPHSLDLPKAPYQLRALAPLL